MALKTLSAQFARLQTALGYRFTQTGLLAQALTHRSFATTHNERLEFLGDAVLNCAVAHVLYRTFPELPEGSLSRLRANLVRQETLAAMATELRLGESLRLGEGEMKSGGARRPSILADALESLLGAIYLDGGFDAASGVVDRLFAERVRSIDPSASGKDPKTQLQEILQARRQPLPEYRLLGTRGEAHAQEFHVECVLADPAHVSQGAGRSRRAAEQEAARAACVWLEAQGIRG